MEGFLEVIMGCMFSGKSTELINRIRKHKIIGSRIKVINHVSDTRYKKDAVMTHNMEQETALCVSDLMPLKTSDWYSDTHVIFIEEGQFFADLYDFVVEAVDNDKKHIIVCGLDGDYLRDPIGQILRLVPFADKVMRLEALCAVCRDGTAAPFSKRLHKSTAQQLIGGMNEYSPVCRKHYMAL